VSSHTTEQVTQSTEVPEEAIAAVLASVLGKEAARALVAGPSWMHDAAMKALRDAAPALRKQGAEEERERLLAIVKQFHNNAVRSKIVAEEQNEDSSVESIRVGELREVFVALTDNQEAS
jgi:polyribonucleotide nucleotidyltransferase